MQLYRIRLAPSLVESMTLATMEAYCFRGSRAHKKAGVETYGYIWGGKKSYSNGPTVFYLDKLSVSLTAKRSSRSVFPNHRAGVLKWQLLRRIAPHKTLLAEFHSHPYANAKSMKEDAGFEFSAADFEDFLEEDFFWETSDNNPIMLVQAVCRLNRKGSRGSGWLRRNVCYFDIDDHRFWINAVVGFLDEQGNRRHTGNRTRSVVIEPISFTTTFG
jgi:hypothetical protein